jgi:uncharacterized phage protein (TIGR02218 family)
MSVTFDNSIQALTVDGVHCFATLWTLTRTDAEVFRFTDHSEPITVDGNTFTPLSGISASARQKQAGLQSQNLEIVGILSSDAITNDDLRAGKYRDAQITEQSVDWRYPWAGIFLVATYWLGEVVFTGYHWEAQVTGLARWLRSEHGDLYERLCRHDLGQGICGQGVNLAAITDTGEVTSILGTGRSKFQSDLNGEADAYYSHGLLTWLTGDNTGFSFEVATYAQTNGVFKLHLVTPYDIQVGDTFEVYPGCNKKIGTCFTKFNNVINFGGFPHIPGNDRMLAPQE